MKTSAVAICPWCGESHPNQVCLRIKAIEYHPDGSTKRVEFKTASDYVDVKGPWGIVYTRGLSVREFDNP